MLSLDQVRLLESRVAKALGYIDELSGENGGLRSGISSLREENSALRARLLGYEKRIKDLEILVQDFQQDQGRIEAGILSALEKLNAFEETVDGVVVHSDRVGESLVDTVSSSPLAENPDTVDSPVSAPTIVESESEVPETVTVEGLARQDAEAVSSVVEVVDVKDDTGVEPEADAEAGSGTGKKSEETLFAEIPDPLGNEASALPVHATTDGTSDADILSAEENNAEDNADEDDDAPFTLRAINFPPAAKAAPEAPAKVSPQQPRSSEPAADEAPRSPRRGPDSDELDIF